MRRPFLSLSSLLFLSAGLSAPAVSGQQMRAADIAACPVELSANHHSDGITLPAVELQQDGPRVPRGSEGKAHQMVELSVKNTGYQPIVGAEVEVHGTTSAGRTLRADKATPTVTSASAELTEQPTTDAVRRLHLSSPVPADESRTKLLTVADLTSVAWIRLVELQYADGSTWRAGRGRECRVEPNHLMLIAGK
jgi:hypothetical protein